MDMSIVRKTELKCPIAIEWPIPEYRLRALKDKPGESLISEVYNASNIPGIEYYLEIYPNDNDNEGETWIYLYLEYTSMRNVAANFDISVESAGFLFEEKHVYERAKGRGEKICTTEELFDPANKYIVDGKLTITMEGFLIVLQEMPQEKNSIADHADLLCVGLWNQEETKDFTIVAEGKEVTVHKSVLSTRSPVFAGMFESGLKEAQEGKVEIKDFSFEIVEMAVKLCYHQNLALGSSLEDKMRIIQFFDKYDIQPLKDDLETYFISAIDVSNVCLLANCSLLSNSRKLEEKCAEFLRKCLKMSTPVLDFEHLDGGFIMNLLKKSFRHVSV